jgi:hypothetical protein
MPRHRLRYFLCYSTIARYIKLTNIPFVSVQFVLTVLEKVMTKHILPMIFHYTCKHRNHDESLNITLMHNYFFFSGSRFALMSTKIAMVHLIKDFCLKPSMKTEVPFKFSNFSMFLKAENGIWLNIEKV